MSVFVEFILSRTSFLSCRAFCLCAVLRGCNGLFRRNKKRPVLWIPCCCRLLYIDGQAVGPCRICYPYGCTSRYACRDSASASYNAGSGCFFRLPHPVFHSFRASSEKRRPRLRNLRNS